ncbi:MAG: metallophosphatase domain-containing protein [Candidatus Obscuribacterales bacterium]
MKCVAVSDIHLRDVRTPPADLLIVTGDMSMKGSPEEMSWFGNWLDRQPAQYKVWIAGNHEVGIEEEPDLATQIAFETGSVYLNDSEIEIEGIRIWGSPITPWFYDWAFNRKRGAEIRKHWDKIPAGIDILLTHGPPHGYLDLNRSAEHCGCEELTDVIMNTLRRPPRYHIFGHIHSGYGRSVVKRKDHQTFEVINASSCNERYQAVNEPVEFEISPQPQR